MVSEDGRPFEVPEDEELQKRSDEITAAVKSLEARFPEKKGKLNYFDEVVPEMTRLQAEKQHA